MSRMLSKMSRFFTSALTDKADHSDEADRWVFPAVTLDPGGYLIVFASKKDRFDPAGNLHTDFSLSKNGEYLALLNPSGVEVSEFAPAFSTQFSDISYGMPAGAFTLVDRNAPLSSYLFPPTPGGSNGEAFTPGPLIFSTKKAPTNRQNTSGRWSPTPRYPTRYLSMLGLAKM